MGRHSQTTEAQELVNPQALQEKLDMLATNISDIVEETVATRMQLNAANEKAAEQAEKEKQERIAAAKKAARLAEARDVIPTNTDKETAKKITDIAKKLKIEFLIHHTVPKAGPGDLLASSFGAAREIQSLLQETGVGPQVKGYYFGSSRTKNDLPVAVLEEADSYKTASASGNDFEAAAEHIRNDSESAQEKGKIYVILTDGNLSGNTEHLAYILEALKLNLEATVNFVVVSKEEETKLNKLLEALKDTPAGKRIKVAKVAKASETLAAAKQAIRNHVSVLNADVVADVQKQRADKDSRATTVVAVQHPSATWSLVKRFRESKALFGQQGKANAEKAKRDAQKTPAAAPSAPQ